MYFLRKAMMNAYNAKKNSLSDYKYRREFDDYMESQCKSWVDMINSWEPAPLPKPKAEPEPKPKPEVAPEPKPKAKTKSKKEDDK